MNKTTDTLKQKKENTPETKSNDEEAITTNDHRVPLTGLTQEDIDVLEAFRSEIMEISDRTKCQQFFNEKLPKFGKKKHRKTLLYLCMRQPAFLTMINQLDIDVPFLLFMLQEYHHESWNQSFIMSVPVRMVKENDALMIKMIRAMRGCEVFLDDSHFKKMKIIHALCECYGGSLHWLAKSNDYIRSNVDSVKKIMKNELRRWKAFDPYLHDAVVDHETVKYKDEIVEWWKLELETRFPNDYRNGKYPKSYKKTENLSIKMPVSMDDMKDELNEKQKRRIEDFQYIQEQLSDRFLKKKPKVEKQIGKDGTEIDVVRIPNYHDDLIEALQVEYDNQMQVLRKELKAASISGKEEKKSSKK